MLARARWIHGPVSDLLLAFCWVPFAVAAHLLEPHTPALRQLVGAVFLLSFFHQPLTLGLVYGDKVQYAARARLYRWAPLVAFAAVVVGLNVSLALVAVVAGLWNAEHTLMQRYGLTRIYGRKAGDDHGRLEKAMIVAGLAFVMVWVAAFVDLPGLVDHIGTGGTNARGIAVLHSMAPLARWLVVPVGFAVVVAVARWWRAERTLGAAANPAKHAYLVATAALLVLVMADPIAGFAGYVAGHALEYLVIVHRSLRSRAATGDRSAVARAAATPARRVALYGGYTAAAVAFWLVSWNVLDGRIYGFGILFFGALHILYDGFVWKLRRPQLAASLGAGVAAPPVAVVTA
jgi:hypothetical protein